MIQVEIIKTRKLTFVNYCYVVANLHTGCAILIDPAWEADKFNEILTQNNWQPTAVLLTHHHPDHVHLAPHFAKYYNIPIYMGKAEIDYYHYACPNLVPIATDQDLIINTIPVYPIATPGHTYGGICYRIEKHLFTGDTLFNEGCGMCFGKGSDPYQLYASLEKLKNELAGDTIIYPGHCYGLPIGQTLAKILNYNIYLQFHDAEAFAAFRMRKNQGSWFNFQ